MLKSVLALLDQLVCECKHALLKSNEITHCMIITYKSITSSF